MTRDQQALPPREFIEQLQKMVLEAPNEDAAIAAMPNIFERDFKLALNGQTLGWDWLEEHIRQVHTRLEKVHVEVTHAVRNEQILMDRHIVTGTTAEEKEPWEMEIMAVYEISPNQKIAGWHELTQMRVGTYAGGW